MTLVQYNLTEREKQDVIKHINSTFFKFNKGGIITWSEGWKNHKMNRQEEANIWHLRVFAENPTTKWNPGDTVSPTL